MVDTRMSHRKHCCVTLLASTNSTVRCLGLLGLGPLAAALHCWGVGYGLLCVRTTAAGPAICVFFPLEPSLPFLKFNSLLLRIVSIPRMQPAGVKDS